MRCSENILTFLLCFLNVCVESEHISVDHVDLFSSTAELEKLFVKEQIFNTKLKLLSTYLKHKRTVLDSLLRRDSEDCSSSLNSSNHLKESQKLNGELKLLLQSAPTHQDIEGAVNGIFLLHETYNLNLTTFSKGLLGRGRFRGHCQLQSDDMEIIGKAAYNRHFYDRAIEWFDAAVRKAKNETRIRPEIEQLENTLAVIQKKHDQVLDAKGPFGLTWRTFTLPFQTNLRKSKKYKKIKERRYQHKHTLFEPLLTGQSETFNALCRGEPMRPSNMDKDLKCIFLHSHDPYLKLGPFKLEQRSLQPYIGIFRDFMYDSEASHYINHAKETGLVRSLLRTTKSGDVGLLSVRRTSAHAWLHEREKESGLVLDALAEKYSERIAMATRMNAIMDRGAEPYLITNYGIGGVYDVHTDGGGEDKLMRPDATALLDTEGARMATSMTYLSEVEEGGATVFPNLGISVWPRMGDMVFWFNNDHNGKLDGLTSHGGCPVLVGSKWIANKWMRSFGQFGKFSCSTKPPPTLRRIKPLTNDGY